MTNRKYALGLDFGTNSVRALVVDVGERRRGRHGHLRLPERPGRHPPRSQGHQPGPPESGRLDPRYRDGRARGPGRGEEEGQRLRSRLRRRHRRRHDGFDPTPRRPGRQAARPLQGVQEEPERPRLALEGPHGTRRSRGDHRPRRGRAPRVSGQVRRDLFLRVVLEQDPPLPADGPEGRLGRLFLGRVRRLHPRPSHRDRRSAEDEAEPLRRRPQGHVQRPLGRPARRKRSWPSSTRASASSATASTPRPTRPTSPPAG